MRCALGTLACVLLGAACKKSTPPPSAELLGRPPPAPASPAAPARCMPASTAPPFVLGPPGAGSARATADAGEPGRDEILPFAAEVGDGVAYGSGFAVGAVYESVSSLSMAIITLDANGQDVKVIPLGAVHGDIEPPRVVARNAMLAVAVLEPAANGRSLRLAKIEHDAVTWGATLHEKAGESQAFDVGLGEKKGIVVWDEDGEASSVVQVSTFEASTLLNATPPRTISPPSADAESPRLAARPGGGYWLAYVARAERSGDFEAGYTAEDIGFRWIEVVPLDANGSPTGAARAATPKDGHVMVFDLAPAPEGGVLVAYRNDDTPSGSAGGEVMRVVVHPSNLDPPSVLVEDEVGAGVPNLLPGWIAMLDAADTTRLAPLSALGEMTAPLSPEPDVGSGEPIAGSADRLLVARPAGRALKLVVLRCNAQIAPRDP